MALSDEERRAQSEVRALALGPAQQLIELARPWVLFALYVSLVATGHWIVAVPVAAAVCFASFCQLHDAIHDSLGLSKRANSIVLTLAGQLLLKSGHAIRATHLRHHGKCLGEEDPEGAPAHWPLTRVFIEGPFHIFALRQKALEIAPRTKRAQLIETAMTAIVLAAAIAAFVIWRSPVGLIYWGVAALVSATLPIWAAYVPHRLATRSPPVRAAGSVARIWTPVVNSFAYHHVHHAYPRVPTALLPDVARILGPGALEVHAHLHHDHDHGGAA